MQTTRQEGETGSQTPRGTHFVKPEKRSRKKRRWRLVATLLVLAGLIVLILLAPRIVSTDWGRRIAIGLANDRLKGQVNIEQLDLTWLGPCRASGISVQDVQGRDVLQINGLSYGKGLLTLMTKPAVFERIVAESPRTTLYLDREGRASLTDALSMKRPRKKAARPMPVPVGVIKVTSGRILLVNPQGRSYLIDGIDVEISFDSLARMQASVAFVPAGGGKVAANVDLKAPADTEGLSFEAASGSFSLTTEGPVDLAPLAAFLGQDDLRGRASLEIDGKLARGKLTARAEAKAEGVQSARLDRATVRPIDVSVSGDLDWTGAGGSSSIRLDSQAGTIEASLSYASGDRDTALGSVPRAVIDVLAGRRSDLPDLAFELDGMIDIPALAKAVPAVLRIQPDVEVSSGLVKIEKVRLIGGAAPSVTGRLTLTDLQAARGEATISPTPVEISVDARLGKQTGPVVRSARLTSGFAEVNARGTVEDMSGRWHLDLAGLHQELGGIFDLKPVPPCGRLEGSLRLFRQDEDPGNQSRFDLAVRIRELTCIAAGRETHVPRTVLDCKGRLLTEKRRPVQMIVEQGELQLGDDPPASFSGGYHFRQQSFDWQVELPQADLAKLCELIPPERLSWLGDVAGKIKLEAAISRSPSSRSIDSTGSAAVTDLSIDGRRLGSGAFQIEWSDARYYSDEKTLKIESAGLSNESLRVAAKGLQLAMAQQAQVSGNLDVTADIGECAGMIAVLTKRAEQTEVDGQLRWQGEFSSDEGAIATKGGATVKELEFAIDGEQVRLDDLRLDHEATFDIAARRVQFDKLAFATDPLKLQMTGTVESLSDRWDLDLAGSYEGSWDKLMPVLYRLVPAAEQRFLLAGSRRGRFAVKGPARQLDLQPIFRGLRADTALGWQRAEILGIKLSEAEFTPRLEEGLLYIPTTVIPAESGKARLAGQVDFTGPQPTYILPGRVMLLENLPVTPQISRDLLSRFNPIFAEATSISGEISLLTEDLRLPLSKQIAELGKGRGHLGLEKLKVVPEGILAELLRFGFADPSASREVSVRGVDFVIRDGRVYYDEFALVFSDQFELGFRGSVGFDDTLDMAVSVPVSAALLDRFGVRGPVADYARVLDGVRVEIPLVGTRMNPRLDFSKVDIGTLIQQAASVLLSEQAGQIIGDILKPPRSAPRSPDTQPADQVDLDGLLAPIFDLLKDRKQPIK